MGAACEEKTTLSIGPVQTGPEYYAKGRLGFGICAACVFLGQQLNFGYVSRVLEVGAAYCVAVLDDLLQRLRHAGLLNIVDELIFWTDSGPGFRCLTTQATTLDATRTQEHRTIK